MAVSGNIAFLPQALDRLRELLPSDWAMVTREPQVPEKYPIRPDAELAIWTPPGQQVRVLVEAKPRLDPAEVSDLARELANWPSPNMVAAPFLSTGVRERLEKAGVSYADATRNIRLKVN